MRSGPSLGTVYKNGALWLSVPQSFVLLPMKTMAVRSPFYFKLLISRWLCVEEPCATLQRPPPRGAPGPGLLVAVSSAGSAVTFVSTESQNHRIV